MHVGETGAKWHTGLNGVSIISQKIDNEINADCCWDNDNLKFHFENVDDDEETSGQVGAA